MADAVRNPIDREEGNEQGPEADQDDPPIGDPRSHEHGSIPSRANAPLSSPPLPANNPLPQCADDPSPLGQADIARAIVVDILPDVVVRQGLGGVQQLRGLAHVPYFATVLQCSLLTSVHEKASLAAAIALIFEKQVEDAPESYMWQAIPSQEGISRLFGTS